MESIGEITFTCTKHQCLDEFGRSLMLAYPEKKRIGVSGPTNLSKEDEQALLTRLQQVVIAHTGQLDKLFDLLAKLGGDISIYISRVDQAIPTLMFGKSLQKLVEKTPKLEGFPAWGARDLVAQLFAYGQEEQLCKVLSTMYPIDCEGYLLAGIFSFCSKFKMLSFSATSFALNIETPMIFARVLRILDLRRQIGGYETIPAMLEALGVRFDWKMVESVRAIIDVGNLPIKTEVSLSASLWKAIERELALETPVTPFSIGTVAFFFHEK